MGNFVFKFGGRFKADSVEDLFEQMRRGSPEPAADLRAYCAELAKRVEALTGESIPNWPLRAVYKALEELGHIYETEGEEPKFKN